MRRLLLALALLRVPLASAVLPPPGACGEEPRKVGEIYSPGEESAWIVEQGGVRLGYCCSRYLGEVVLGVRRAHHFREQVVLAASLPTGRVEQRFTNELWTDAGGHPLRFDFRSQFHDVKAGVEASLSDGKAELRIGQGGTPRPMTLDVPGSAFLLANNFISELELLLALELPESRTGEWTLLSVNALRTFPFSVGPAEQEGFLQDSLGERLRFEHGRLEQVEIPAQKIVIRRVDESFEPFTIELARPMRAADLDYEEVGITDGDVHLAGTISRPRGVEGRLPAVFFLSGSGGQDRDGFAQGVDLGTHEILDHLTRAGLLVLRLDDRGVGESTGPTEELTFDDLVEDGRRAVRLLRARPDVDPGRIALIGHSEGGLSGPILAASEPIAALVLMAAPARSIEVLLGEQLGLERRLAGGSADEVEALQKELHGFLEVVRGSDPIAREGLAPELAEFLPSRAWLRSHLDRDPLAVLRGVPCPVLILQGARDVQVSAERDAPLLLKTLDDARHTDHELRVFPELDHLFKRASSPDAGELDYLKSRPIDPEFLTLLGGWLTARLAR